MTASSPASVREMMLIEIVSAKECLYNMVKQDNKEVLTMEQISFKVIKARRY